MIPFKNRFHGHGSLRYIYKKGKTVRSRLMTIRSTDNPRRKTPRIAVVISKKTLKSAVGRNRIRRRLYEIIRKELPYLAPNSDIVILVFASEVRSLPFAEVEQALIDLLKKSGLYRST